MLALRINQTRSVDVVSNSLFNGRMLAVVNCYSREGLAIHVGLRIKKDEVIRVLKF